MIIITKLVIINGIVPICNISDFLVISTQLNLPIVIIVEKNLIIKFCRDGARLRTRLGGFYGDKKPNNISCFGTGQQTVRQ